MSLPTHALPRREEAQPGFRESSQRQRREESERGGYADVPSSPYSPTTRQEPSSPTTVPGRQEIDPETRLSPKRKRNLVRPERSRIDSDHPNYHYRQHAQNVPTYPSTTG